MAEKEKKNPFECSLELKEATFTKKETGELVTYVQPILVLPYHPYKIKIRGFYKSDNIRLKDYIASHSGE